MALSIRPIPKGRRPDCSMAWNISSVADLNRPASCC
jgi:hypothetical protein